MHSFVSETVEQAKSRAEKTKQAQSRAREALQQAKKCLSIPEFIKYKQNYEDARETIIDSLINFSQSAFGGTASMDPMKYAFIVKTQLDKLGNLRYLLKDVERDASRKVKDV